MKKRTATRNRERTKPGPKPEVIKIEGDWEQAVKKSFAKKKPKGGWPK
jgi:hypothetical protein